VKDHRAARKDPVEGHPGLGLGAFLDPVKEAGDDVDEGHPLVQKLTPLVHEAGAEDTLERAHEAPLHTFEQRTIGRLADEHLARLVVKEKGRRHRGLAWRHLDEARPAVAEVAGSRVRGAEVDPQPSDACAMLAFLVIRRVGVTRWGARRCQASGIPLPAW
jgi:hypothetical protein